MVIWAIIIRTTILLGTATWIEAAFAPGLEEFSRTNHGAARRHGGIGLFRRFWRKGRRLRRRCGGPRDAVHGGRIGRVM
jgi:hypothetical protein